MLLRPHPSLLIQALAPPPFFRRATVPVRRTLSATSVEAAGTASAGDGAPPRKSARKAAPPPPRELVRTALFLPPGVERDADVPAEAVIPGSNIVVGPYAGDAKVKGAEFVKSSASARDCPKDDRPEFAVLGRSNVGKSSLINALTRRKEAALTSKKPGKTQTINHFLINKSWYLVDLPGYGTDCFPPVFHISNSILLTCSLVPHINSSVGDVVPQPLLSKSFMFAAASQTARMDWSSFTKGYFLNRDTLVGVLLLIDASIPPTKIDLDCANWLGRNNIGFTFVFTKCDKVKKGKGGRPGENIKEFQDTISGLYAEPPPWIMTSSVTGLGRDGLLLHMSQLRNYWDNESV
ncbi:hypothetical protein PR202_ga26511 [Eleusine coracana subsp. coracana]|uniref:EngB-type G domain-containing protein n=1 Tax=Eleusine coracana subsp. coracana TaxID=191504 RepID=A0AAV5DEF2_ELECO|nr:hypothetical protein PR202_ga26511 [Eleusine coracana subsp. coracana]